MVFLLLSDPPGRPRPSLSAPNVWRVVPPPCSDSGVSAVALPKARPLQQQASHATTEGLAERERGGGIYQRKWEIFAEVPPEDWRAED